MARWKLLQPHYLNVPGTEWEYKETDRTTGRQARKVFQVPLFLHPDDPADQNYPGEIIVGYKPQGRDIVFVGPPTPDMEPLDEEAQAISDRERPKWKHPIDSLASQGYSQSLLDDLMRQMSEIHAGTRTSVPSVSAPGIDPAAFASLQQQVAALLEQNKALMEKLADDDEPLDDVPVEPIEPAAPLARRL